MEAKVVQPLSNYGMKCKQTKNDLKGAFSATDREKNAVKKLTKVQQKSPGDRHQINTVTNELQKASVLASKTTRNLEEHIEKFEMEKLEDMKVCILLLGTRPTCLLYFYADDAPHHYY